LVKEYNQTLTLNVKRIAIEDNKCSSHAVEVKAEILELVRSSGDIA
jgi:hypothetical protein